jgi:hypothetical protein
MIALIIVSAVLLFISGTLFVPLKIVLNTKEKEYYISLPGYLRADLMFESMQSIKVKLRVFFFTFRIEPGNATKIKEKYTYRKQKRRKIQRPLLLAKNQLKNFRIKKLNASIDTGNFPLNAQLIPIAGSLNRRNINLNINFENKYELDVCIVTRLYKIIYTTIKHYISNK